jgi:hypothetical protein
MIYHHAAACCISTAKPTLSMQTTTDLIRGLAIVESVYYQSQFQHLINFAHRRHRANSIAERHHESNRA